VVFLIAASQIDSVLALPVLGGVAGVFGPFSPPSCFALAWSRLFNLPAGGGRRYLKVVESYRIEASSPSPLWRCQSRAHRLQGDGHLDPLIRGLCRAAGRDEREEPFVVFRCGRGREEPAGSASDCRVQPAALTRIVTCGDIDTAASCALP